MFVFNLKVNKNGASKIIMVIFVIICISLVIASIFKMTSEMNNEDKNFVNDKIPSSDIAILTPENYTNVLKEVHDDLSTYLGQKISFSGYVYRVPRITAK